MSYISIFIAQFLYTASDVWKKIVFNTQGGFNAATFIKPAFILALIVAGVGFLFQLHALAKIELSRTIIIMGMLAIIFSATAGVIFFKEHLNIWNVAGIVLALTAIVLVNIK